MYMQMRLIPERYLEEHQSRSAEPTNYEDLLGDAIERAYGQMIWDLPGLIAYLNETGPSAPSGQPWTEESFKALMARLGA